MQPVVAATPTQYAIVALSALLSGCVGCAGPRGSEPNAGPEPHRAPHPAEQVPATETRAWTDALPGARVRAASNNALVVDHGRLRIRVPAARASARPTIVEAARALGDRAAQGLTFPDRRPLPSLDLAPADWTLPPSHRPTPAGGAVQPDARPLAEIDSGGVTLAGLVSAGLDDASALGLVVLDDGETGGLLCVETEARVDCAPTELTSLETVGRSPDGWLVTGRGGAAGRGGVRLLGALSVSPDGLVHETLVLAEARGSGESCAAYEGHADRAGYCVGLSGAARLTQMLDAGCVEQRPGPRWSALHARVDDVWLDETTAPAPECARTSRVAGGRFVDEACGPATEVRRCTDADLAVD